LEVAVIPLIRDFNTHETVGHIYYDGNKLIAEFLCPVTDRQIHYMFPTIGFSFEEGDHYFANGVRMFRRICIRAFSVPD